MLLVNSLAPLGHICYEQVCLFCDLWYCPPLKNHHCACIGHETYFWFAKSEILAAVDYWFGGHGSAFIHIRVLPLLMSYNRLIVGGLGTRLRVVYFTIHHSGMAGECMHCLIGSSYKPFHLGCLDTTVSLYNLWFFSNAGRYILLVKHSWRWERIYCRIGLN